MIVATRENLRGKLLLNEPMSAHTTWQIGGPADVFYAPADVSDLQEFLVEHCDEETPLHVVGRGSNLLVRDAGVRGIVISTESSLKEMCVLSDNRLRVEAGVASARVAQFSSRNGLAGCEFLSGVPGNFGGALAMNAGAYGGETWDWVESVETLNRCGELRTRRRDEFDIAYRSIKGLNGEIFVSAILCLQPGDRQQGKETVRGFMKKRNASQPVKLANAGSVFRNPNNDYAARLIEYCGLKGRCIGGACISHQHANFIVNEGSATATDVESLMVLIEQTVERETGVVLSREVQVVGECE